MSTSWSLRKKLQESGRGRHAGLVDSQVILFNSRKKWGVLYALATLAGMFCVPGAIQSMGAEPDVIRLVVNLAPLPAVTLLIATGMYILNDLVDSDLDRLNGKQRPIPSGRVSKSQAKLFVVSTNAAATALAVLTQHGASIAIVAPMLAIGVMYSAPKIALMNRFAIKTIAISAFYALCAVLGIASGYGFGPALESPVLPLFSIGALGVMIFISSTLNDLGDIKGDRAAGRKTLPVVLGPATTLRILTVLAGGLAVTSLILYETLTVGSLAMAGFSAVLIWRIEKIGKGLDSMDSMAVRNQHKKIFPMHMVLQFLLASCALFAI